jgi:hypothetical protein
MADQTTNVFGEPLFMGATYEHPAKGKYKDQNETFFMDKIVRIYSDVEVGGQPFRAPLWLDVVRFDDVAEAGCRLALGRVNSAVLTADTPIRAGLELYFHPEEVFDVADKPTVFDPTKGVYKTVAVADKDAPVAD